MNQNNIEFDFTEKKSSQFRNSTNYLWINNYGSSESDKDDEKSQYLNTHEKI